MEQAASPPHAVRSSWFPLAVVMLCQIPMSFNELIEQVNFDNTNYITSDQLATILDERGATPAEVDAALEIYEDARLRALRTTLMFLASLALLALVPAGRMPDFREPDLTAEDEEGLTLATPRPGR